MFVDRLQITQKIFAASFGFFDTFGFVAVGIQRNQSAVNVGILLEQIENRPKRLVEFVEGRTGSVVLQVAVGFVVVQAN